MNRKRIIITAIVLVILALIMCLIFKACGQIKDLPTLPLDGNVVEWNGNQQLPQAVPDVKGIVIPGFNAMTFVANQTTQAVNFYNPGENGDRLFLMSLYISDNLMWQSGYVPAGNGYYEIELSEPLAPGEYQAYLRIEVFTPENVQLNGARVDFDLLVQEVKQ